MANPKITYDPGTGLTTLSFQYPPRLVPGYSKKAIRHDNLSSAGVRESVLERVDQFLEFNMETILAGSDATAWEAFLDYALQGGSFQYYPDSSLSAFTNYLLENADAKLQYVSVGRYKLNGVKFRLLVT